MATFNGLWNIIILESTLPQSTVQGWISAASIPSCINFIYGGGNAAQWDIASPPGSNANVPIPTTPWTIAISSNQDAQFSWGTNTGFAWTALDVISIEYDPTNPLDTSIALGARIWHGICLCYGLPADSMTTSEYTGFQNYLDTVQSQYYQAFITNPADISGDDLAALHILYYTYLMQTYLPCPCYTQEPSQCSTSTGGTTTSYVPNPVSLETGIIALAGGLVATLIVLL